MADTQEFLEQFGKNVNRGARVGNVAIRNIGRDPRTSRIGVIGAIPIGLDAMQRLPDQPTGAAFGIGGGLAGLGTGWGLAKMASPVLRRMGPIGRVADVASKALLPYLLADAGSEIGGNLAEGVKQAITGEAKKLPGTTQERAKELSELKHNLKKELLIQGQEGKITIDRTLEMLKGINELTIDATGQLTSIATEADNQKAKNTMALNKGIMDQLLRAGHLGTGRDLAVQGQAIAGNLAGAVLSNNPYSGAFLNPSVQVTI
jgi:hypothetical protein